MNLIYFLPPIARTFPNCLTDNRLTYTLVDFQFMDVSVRSLMIFDTVQMLSNEHL